MQKDQWNKNAKGQWNKNARGQQNKNELVETLGPQVTLQV